MYPLTGYFYVSYFKPTSSFYCHDVVLNTTHKWNRVTRMYRRSFSGLIPTDHRSPASPQLTVRKDGRDPLLSAVDDPLCLKRWRSVNYIPADRLPRTGNRPERYAAWEIYPERPAFEPTWRSTLARYYVLTCVWPQYTPLNPFRTTLEPRIHFYGVALAAPERVVHHRRHSSDITKGLPLKISGTP